MAALVIYNFPIVYLHLRTAFAGIDPVTRRSRALARVLAPRRRSSRVTLPQLWPAYLSAVLLVTLYVFGDFGVVSLMRFETFSYAMYLQYIASYDRAYAAWLGLHVDRGHGATADRGVPFAARSLARTRGARIAGWHRVSFLGGWKWVAYAFVGGRGGGKCRAPGVVDSSTGWGAAASSRSAAELSRHSSERCA